MKQLIYLVIVMTIVSCNSESKSKNLDTKKNITTSRVLKKYYLKRPSYKVEYYADWKIGSSDADFDIDSYWILNSPSDNGSCMFFLFNTRIDEKENITAQVGAYLKRIMKNGKVSHFTQWGNYQGTGAIIQGKFMGVFSGEMKTFAHSNDNLSFLIVSQIYNSDRQQDEPGLKLIESSFRVQE